MDRLPDEIWLEIIGHLGDSHHGLAAIARVCRKSYHLAKPRLYERLPPPGTGSCISPLLVRTLCEDAAIAELVRYGEFVEGTTYDFQAHEVLPAIRACARLPDDFKSVLVTGGPDSDEDIEPDWVALSVALLPNLEELAITIAYDKSALKKALDLNRLPRLRKLRTFHWDTEWAADMWKLMPELFQLGATTLEAFEGHANDWSLELEGGAADDAEPTDDGTAAAVSHETLRDLTLRLAVFDTPGFARLLAACPRLASLRVHWGDACTSDRAELDLPGMGRAIREHAAAGLEVLVLNPQDEIFFDDATEGIGSLRSMKRLRELHLSHHVLAGGDDEDEDGLGSPHDRDALARLLPASLEELYLEARLWPPPLRVWEAQVRRLVEDRQEFPKLRRVELGGLNHTKFDMRGWTDYGWKARVVDLQGDLDYLDMAPKNRIRLERMDN